MKSVELYARVRFAVQIEGVSRREAARRFGIDPRTVAKMLAFSVPPGYRLSCCTQVRLLFEAASMDLPRFGGEGLGHSAAVFSN